MTLNPLTLIEKTINGHGSAVILKERIDLARDQYAALERKLNDATSLIAQHESAIQQLQSENGDLRVKLKQYEQQIQDLQSRLEPTHKSLHDNEETILKYLATCDHATIDELVAATRIGKQTITMHVSQLEGIQLIDHFDGYMDYHYRLTNDGRKRMFNLGLLE